MYIEVVQILKEYHERDLRYCNPCQGNIIGLRKILRMCEEECMKVISKPFVDEFKKIKDKIEKVATAPI